VTNGLKPDGQTTSVGEEGDINKTSSPPLDFFKKSLDLYWFLFVSLGVIKKGKNYE